MSSLPPVSETGTRRYDATRSDHALTAVADAVGRLRYGAVQVTIHDGKVVQIDVTERQRFA